MRGDEFVGLTGMGGWRSVRTACGVGAIVLMGLGVYLLGLGWRHWRLLRQCLEDRPLDIAVDLSRPGEYESSLRLKCPYGFGYDLLLVLPSDASSVSGGDGLLAGLDARCSIMDVNGGERLPSGRMGQISPEIVEEIHERPICLHSIRVPFPRGEYTFRLTISEGARRLSGIEQRLVMKYLVGGEGSVPFIALGCGAVALAGGGASLWWLRRRRGHAQA